MTIRTLTLTALLLATVAAGADTYVVRRGDTLNKISQRLGVSIDAIKKANGLSNSNTLHRGQTLQIPSTAQPQPSASNLGTAQIVPSSVIPHAGPFDGSKALDPLKQGDSFTALQRKQGWVELQLPGGAAWLPSETVAITAPQKPVSLVSALAIVPTAKAPVHKQNVIQKIAASGNSLLKKALTYRGVRYRWGGTSRSSGVDCSGFTSSVFHSQGIDLPRTSIEQSHIGTPVAKSELQPGDLVFFRTSRSIRVNHVGIYVGDGKFIHAATGAGHVMVSSLDEPYFMRSYATARRVAEFDTAKKVAVESQNEVGE